MQPILQETLTRLHTQNKEYFEEILELRKTNHEYLERIIELPQENQRLSTELFDLKQSLFESHMSSVSKKPKTRKTISKKTTTSATPPPHFLKQMEKAIALLNQQQGINTSLDDFDIFPIELDDSNK